MQSYNELGSLIDTYIVISYYGLSEGGGDFDGVPAIHSRFETGLTIKHEGAHQELARMDREITRLVERYETMLGKVVGGN